MSQRKKVQPSFQGERRGTYWEFIVVRNRSFCRELWTCVALRISHGHYSYWSHSHFYYVPTGSTKTSLECIYSLVFFITSQQQCILKVISVYEKMKWMPWVHHFLLENRSVQRAWVVRWRGSVVQTHGKYWEQAWCVHYHLNDRSLKLRKPNTSYANLQD